MSTATVPAKVPGKLSAAGQARLLSGLNTSSNKYFGPPVNRTVVISAMVIVLTGAAHVLSQSTDPAKNLPRLMKVFVGGYVFVLVISLLDLFGGSMRQITSGLAILAATTAVLSSDLIPMLKGLVQA